MTKVFVLVYYSWDDTEVIGVYKTRKLAEEDMNHFSEREKEPFYAYSGFDIFEKDLIE